MTDSEQDKSQSGDQACVTVEHLCKRFQSAGETREVLRDVSLNVAAGSALAIMGPSGSGKSTLLNILGTLDRPTSGTVRICGADPFALSETEAARFRNLTIGFIFQSHHLLPQCSVLENVLLPTLPGWRVGVLGGAGVPAGRHGSQPCLPTEGKLERAQRLLDRVGLTARMHDRPARLSGGERQRAAVVRALINCPRLVLADEPTGSLDQASAATIGVLLTELKREENLALIVVTHTLDLARRMDALMNLRDGVLAE